jgi:hypothetical protein
MHQADAQGTDQGEGRAYVILHRGAGPGSVFGLAAALAKNGHSLVSEAGRFPQIERLDEVVRLIGDFTSGP